MKKSTKYSMTIALVAVSFAATLMLPMAGFAAGPMPVDLMSSANFAVLSKTGITNTGSHTSYIHGSIGASPITAAAMDNVFCSEITGTIYGVDAAYTGSGNQSCFMGNPPASNKTLVDNAVGDMATAYNNLAAVTNPGATELGAGNIGSMTLAPGLYKWSTDVTIPTDVTLSGGANDIWIFQIAGDLSIASAGSVYGGIKVILTGGANPTNIFWQVGGPTGVVLGTYSTFNGNILSAKQVIMQTGAVLHGRALAQTQVTLDGNTIWIPSTTVIYALPATPATPASPTTGSPAIPSTGATPTMYASSNAMSEADRQALIGRIGDQIRAIQARILVQGGATPNASAVLNANTNASFLRDLTVGAGGDDVKALQVWLNSHGYAVASAGAGSSGNETLRFGALTRGALARFQAYVGISPASGFFGPKTKAYLKAHY